MNKKKIFIIIGIFWVAIIGGFIAFKEFTLQTGNQVLLKVRPVDPRDLFRGDYVVLRYDISSIDTDGYYQASDFKEGDKVYVLLDVDNDKVATFANIDRNKPDGGAFIKGTVKEVFGSQLNIEYGIESYFVPEGKGGQIQSNIRKIYAKVAINNFGGAVIKSLVMDGKDVELK